MSTLEDINVFTAKEFEEFVADIFRNKGSRATLVDGQGDHGVDIVVTGRDGTKVLVQCKRYAPDCLVGERGIRDLYGTLMADSEASKACVVTTGFCSQRARAWA